ncbi:FadR family transcriptional regulator, partial [Mycobacterium tuberculosis]|nr:FadR family transcriptional regulator [Mycobacterium tuberculosis]
RPTIREALKRLAAQNLLRSRRGPMGGTFVNGPSLEEARADLAATTTMLVGMGQFSLDEIAAVRLSLETLCARLAAVHRSDADLAALADEIALQATTDLTDVEFCASDVRFHRRLADQEGARDAGERQAGDDAQRQRHLLRRRQLRVAADEQQTQHVVTAMRLVE